MFELKALKRYKAGIEGLDELILRYAEIILARVFHIRLNMYKSFHARKMRKLFGREDAYHIKEARLPILDDETERELFYNIFYDTFTSYCYFDERYDEKTFDECDEFLSEGLYGLVNDKVNVTIRPGDIVIDAGSWIGDFAAYASVKGASVYAFEPTETTFAILQKTAQLNGNIIPVKKGLSDENASAIVFVNENLTSGNSLMDKSINDGFAASSTVETIRLDDFVRENNIPRVDFIKADIEGFERRMLAGAQETLARFAPKLALCTYHLPDDPQVMADLIKQANQKYNIVQKRKKLFASVPQE